jgi:hypothetical protein
MLARQVMDIRKPTGDGLEAIKEHETALPPTEAGQQAEEAARGASPRRSG